MPAAVVPSRASRSRLLPWLGLVAGLWAVIPPYVGPELANLQSRLEIADHVVPSVSILAMSVICLVRTARGDRGGSFPLVAGFTVALAGLWMTATHLPLVRQAQRGQAGVTKGAAAWHATPGVVILVLGLVWAAATWTSAGAESVPVGSAASGGKGGPSPAKAKPGNESKSGRADRI